MKKYKLADETMEYFGRTLRRIKAVKSFGNVKEGDLGGWIEDEKNLSHDDYCWIDDEAMVMDNAQVYDNAHVYGDSRVYDNAQVYDNAWVYNNAQIYSHAHVYGSACVFNNTHICGNARIYGYAQICGNAQVESIDDIIFIPNIGSRKSTTTFFRCVDNTIKVRCGCFHNTIDEFEKAVKETHGDNKYAKEYVLAIELAKLRILGE